MVVVVLPFLLVFLLAFRLFLIEKLFPHIPLLLVIFAFASLLFALFLRHYLSFLTLYLSSRDSFSQVLLDSFLYSATVEEVSKILFFFISCKVLRLVPNVLSPHVASMALHSTQKSCQAEGRVNDAKKIDEESRKKLAVLAVFFATSFAAFENVGYSLYEPEVLLLRFCTATLLHILIAPFYLGIFKSQLHVIAVSSIIHGTYNFLITLGSVGFLLSLCLLLALLFKHIYDRLKASKDLKNRLI